jgi:hypothetical protein
MLVTNFLSVGVTEDLKSMSMEEIDEIYSNVGFIYGSSWLCRIIKRIGGSRRSTTLTARNLIALASSGSVTTRSDASSVELAFTLARRRARSSSPTVSRSQGLVEALLSMATSNPIQRQSEGFVAVSSIYILGEVGRDHERTNNKKPCNDTTQVAAHCWVAHE